MRHLPAPLLAVLVSLLTWSTPAAGQAVEGRITDPESGAPIPAVNVSLRTVDGEQRASTLADSAGRFRVVTSPGRYLLRLHRLGYEPVSTEPFDLASGQEIQLAVSLTAVAVTLAPLEVTATPRPTLDWLEQSGFHERRALGHGTFLTHEDIVRRGTFNLIDAFRGVRGFRVIRLNHRDYHVVAGRATPPCYPVVFIDGMHMQRIGEDVLNQINPRDVAGIEAYPIRATIPARYNERGRACAAIIIWTR